MRIATETEAVIYEKVDDHIAVVTLNRPEKRNAVNYEISRGLERFVKESEADPDIRAVVLTSSNDKVFCSGADLSEAAKGNYDAVLTPDGGFAGFVFQPRNKVWIAAPKGVTIAGGMEICLACDIIIAADTCTFGLPEVKRSLIAAAGGVSRLPRLVPLNIAVEMVATGEPIDAERAYALGIINKIVPADQAVEAAKAMARTIAANAPVAVRAAVAAVRAASCMTDAEGRKTADALLATVMDTNDYREFQQAFIEKRQPVWRGN